MQIKKAEMKLKLISNPFNDTALKSSFYFLKIISIHFNNYLLFSEKGIQMRLNQLIQHLEDTDEYDSLSTQMCMNCIL